MSTEPAVGDLDTPVEIGGSVASGYEAVRDAFANNFAEHGDVGAAVAVYADGRKVVDLWGGIADKRTGKPYAEDTLQLVFSSTKGVTALVINLLAQRGLLDLDAPVTEYWPEFGASGKGNVPVRWLLSHKVGLPYIDAPLPLEDLLRWDPAVEALAAQEPVWEPGTAHGYHAVTFGWLAGEVIRRVTGKTMGTWVAEELSGPLGLDLWVGLPDEQQERVAPLTTSGLRSRARAGNDGSDPGRNAGEGGQGGGTGSGDLASMIEQFLGPDALLLKALDGAPGIFTQPGIFNRNEVRAAELPAANGITTARSLAKLYATVIGEVDGHGPLLEPAQLRAATEQQSEGADKVLIVDTSFGVGYMLSSVYSPYGGRAGFGHSGAGGSVGFADPENGISFSYTMNRMLTALSGDPRPRDLITAVYDSIGVTPSFV